MAEPITLADIVSLMRDHSDIRREAAEHANEIVKEGIKGDFASVTATKDARHDIIEVTGSAADRLEKQGSDYFIAAQQYAFNAARDVAALKATTDMGLQKIASDIQTQGALAATASALESAKVAAAVALGQAQLERAVVADGNETRRLVNELKYGDLNRALIERNAELAEERHHARHWRGHFDQSQYAAVNSQLQAFASQLQETRQGMVNFGTMAGVGQTSTSNNVR